MSGPWLEAEPGPAPDDLAERIRYWEGLEAAYLRHAPAGLRWGAEPTARPPDAHAEAERWLPLGALRGEVEHLLLAWFGPALARLARETELPFDLGASSLGRARSWLDARAQLALAGERLPSEVLRRLRSAVQAEALLFELFAAPRLGYGLERYPERRAALVAWAERIELPAPRPLRLWDAGCAAGEATWALTIDLARAGRAVEALGTTPWPLELLMAQRNAFPHDPARSAAYAALIASAPPGCQVRFAGGDLVATRPPGAFELVCCHGVLGGVLPGPARAAALAQLRGALSEGGLLSLEDDFRADAHREALAWARAALAGWEELAPGLFRAPPTQLHPRASCCA